MGEEEDKIGGRFYTSKATMGEIDKWTGPKVSAHGW